MTTGPLTDAQMRAFSEKMLDAYNRHDVEAILSDLADDVVWTEPTLVAPAHGKQEVRASLRDTFTAFPDLEVLRDDFRVYPDVEAQTLVVTWTLTGTMTGRLENGVPATGRSVRMVGANEARFRDGLVSEYTFYYDMLEMLQQMGLMPSAWSMGFTAIVLADVMAVKARQVLQRH